MGRCLTFNFSVSELKEKLSGVRYFVFSPDYDGSNQQTDQYFFAALAPIANLKEQLSQLRLNGSSLRVVGENPLYVALDSTAKNKAITEAQVEDVRIVDEKLGDLGCRPVSFTRYQDVVFGEDHLLAAELKNPFRSPGAVTAPSQVDWISGASYEEAQELYQESLKK